MSAGEARLRVDRLALHVPATSEEDARRLARVVAAALRAWPSTPGSPTRIGSLAVHVEEGTSADLDALADRIVEAVLAAVLAEVD